MVKVTKTKTVTVTKTFTVTKNVIPDLMHFPILRSEAQNLLLQLKTGDPSLTTREISSAIRCRRSMRTRTLSYIYMFRIPYANTKRKYKFKIEKKRLYSIAAVRVWRACDLYTMKRHFHEVRMHIRHPVAPDEKFDVQTIEQSLADSSSDDSDDETFISTALNRQPNVSPDNPKLESVAVLTVAENTKCIICRKKCDPSRESNEYSRCYGCRRFYHRDCLQIYKFPDCSRSCSKRWNCGACHAHASRLDMCHEVQLIDMWGILALVIPLIEHVADMYSGDEIVRSQLAMDESNMMKMDFPSHICAVLGVNTSTALPPTQGVKPVVPADVAERLNAYRMIRIVRLLLEKIFRPMSFHNAYFKGELESLMNEVANFNSKIKIYGDGDQSDKALTKATAFANNLMSDSCMSMYRRGMKGKTIIMGDTEVLRLLSLPQNPHLYDEGDAGKGTLTAYDPRDTEAGEDVDGYEKYTRTTVFNYDRLCEIATLIESFDENLKKAITKTVQIAMSKKTAKEAFVYINDSRRKQGRIYKVMKESRSKRKSKQLNSFIAFIKAWY